MPLLATAEHRAAQKQACEAGGSEVNEKTREAEGEMWGQDQQLRCVNSSRNLTTCYIYYLITHSPTRSPQRYLMQDLNA